MLRRSFRILGKTNPRITRELRKQRFAHGSMHTNIYGIGLLDRPKAKAARDTKSLEAAVLDTLQQCKEHIRVITEVPTPLKLLNIGHQMVRGDSSSGPEEGL